MGEKSGEVSRISVKRLENLYHLSPQLFPEKLREVAFSNFAEDEISTILENLASREGVEKFRVRRPPAMLRFYSTSL